MGRFSDNISGSWDRLFAHVASRRFLARNAVVLLLLLCLSIYQARPWWMDVLVVVVYTVLLMGIQWLLVLLLPEEKDEPSKPEDSTD